MTPLNVFVVPSISVFALVIQVSFSFIEKTDHVCHSVLECGRAQLMCDSGQRLAVLGLSRSYRLNLNTSLSEQCPTNMQNCSAIPDLCCQPWNSAGIPDCTEAYSDNMLETAHVNCSAQSPSLGHENVTCFLDLPALPQPSRGRCSKSSLPVFQNLSSYSSVKYACVNESDIAPLCTTSQRKGNLLYTLWTPGESPSGLEGVSNTSCRCSVKSASGSPIKVFVRALDVRIPRSDVSGQCSYVTVVDNVRTVLNTSCDSTILFSTTSHGNGLVETGSPLDVLFTLQANNTPDIVWIGFTGLDSKDLTLTCFDAGENLTRVSPVPHGTTQKDSVPSAPAIIGGVVAAMVFIIIAGFACFNIVRRKRAQNSKGLKTQTWWERTREEDRVAELSQMGPASRVIVDTGRNMGYGKHPPTRRSYPTSDTNPPIYFMSGSAFGQPNSNQPEFADTSTQNREEECEGNAVGGATAASGNQWSQLGVHYTVSPDSKPVVVVTGGPSIKVYDIPPLTIKELDSD